MNNKFYYSLRVQELLDYDLPRPTDVRCFYIEKIPILSNEQLDLDSIATGILYGAQTRSGYEVRLPNHHVLFRTDNPAEMIQKLYEEAQIVKILGYTPI